MTSRRLPTGWQQIPLEELVQPFPGHWGMDVQAEGLTPAQVLGVGNVLNDGNLDVESVPVRYLAQSELECIAQEGDLLVVKSSGSATNIRSGKTAICPHELTGRIACSNFMMLLRPAKDKVEPRWLWRYLNGRDAKAFVQLIAGSSTYPNIKWSSYKKLLVPVPPLPEQQRIVAKLDKQMAALDRAEKALAAQQATALAFKRATLQTALDQAIHPEWECATLMDLCTFANGLWTGKKPPFQQASVIRNTNFTRDCTLDFSDIAHLDVEERQLRSRRLRTGDIILERSGGGPKQPVGRVALFELNDEFYSFSNFTSVIRVNERNGVLPRFLWYYLFHLYSSGVTEALQNHTSGIRNLDFSSYVMLSIPVPTLDEQRRVVEQLDWSIEQANNLLSYVAEQALTLASLRTSLLDAAFSGEISHD